MNLKRYISGIRNGKDINRIEHDALTDPFLADALDGFDKIDGKHYEKINQIQQKILASSGKKIINFSRLTMIVVFLAAIGITGYFTVNQIIIHSKNKNTAKKEFQNLQKTGQSVFNTIKVKNEEKENSDNNEFVTENSNLEEILLYLPVKKIKKKPKEEIKDSTTNSIKLQTDDSIKSAESSDNKDITNSNFNNTDQNSLANEKYIDKVPQPKSGFISFRNYLKRNTIHPTDDECKDSHGIVIVRFTANENGRPVNLRVTKTLCPSCNAEAVRLIQNGPDWTQGNKETSVTVNF